MSNVHVIYDGQTHNFAFDELFSEYNLTGAGVPEGTIPTPETVTPEQIKSALAMQMDVSPAVFEPYNVSVYEGKIDVRPEAVFG